MQKKLDVVCLGRSSVDLYGDQIGLPLEDMSSFSKYVGGCATNIAVGTSRLGLKSALITRVGDEQMGRFIRQTLVDEGVDVSLVSTDPERLTALVILGIRNRKEFPHIFYRENCADMALTEDHIDPDFVGSAKALVLTGTHFSQPGVEAASRKAMEAARAAGTKIVLDIDFRPVAWGLVGHADGENRFVESEKVTRHLMSIMTDCDLIVGTEEEINIAGGSTDTIQSLRNIRGVTGAALVTKRGPLGCSVFPGAIPVTLDNGISVPSHEIEVYNTLGAGDGFMSGFLRGWVRGEDWETCCRFGNASGAIVVSRHGCAPAIPSWKELQYYLANGSPTRRLREDKALEHLHRMTTGRQQIDELCAMAFDHRAQLEAIAASAGALPERIANLKTLVAAAAKRIARSDRKIGMIIDDVYGLNALTNATGSNVWLARPVELPDSRPLRFQHGSDITGTLLAWPRSHVVKCLVQYHPDDPESLRVEQEQDVMRLYNACLRTGHELLLEVIPSDANGDRDEAVQRTVNRFYDIGVFPDWWKLPPSKTSAHWVALEHIIEDRDPQCRGVLSLGLATPFDELARDFAQTASSSICKGFAVGRTLFHKAAEDWFAGRISDEDVVDQIASNFERLIEAWDKRAVTVEGETA
jgi:5-dehydro-2-deoxygluconokinase